MRQAVGGALPEWISLGVLASSVPRDAVDDAVAVCGRGVRRRGGKLPPHVVVYLVMALALFADDDYEEVAARLSETLAAWGCWDREWTVPTSGGITQARQRLGFEPMQVLFEQLAQPVADQLTPGAFVAGRRLLSVDGMVWEVPDTPENRAAFGTAEPGDAFPKVRMVTVTECASRAAVAAAIGPVVGEGSGEKSLARSLLSGLEEGQLLLADSNFYGFEDWCTASDTGADLLWRVGSHVNLPMLEALDDGSYLTVLVGPEVRNSFHRRRVAARVQAGEEVTRHRTRIARVIEYEIPDRTTDEERELICLLTTITDPDQAPAALLAQTYHERWEHETAIKQLKIVLRGPGRILRSKSPDLVRQELYGYLLTHYALAALICRAATEAGIDPDRVKFTRTVRIVRRRVTDSAAFPP